MFTGIVEELGTVRAVRSREGGARLELEAEIVLADAEVGASIAVSGCCLTVVELGSGWWATDVQVETLRRTSLGRLAAGDRVNLERPLRLGDRLGGHLVQGHVDGRGVVSSRVPEADGSVRLRVEAAPEILRYVVAKGSIAVDGVSLTVTTVDRTAFEVALIPHTLTTTTLDDAEEGTSVNLEIDLMAKYVERLVPRTGHGPDEPEEA